MVRAENGAAVARMVELRGVESGFPFYGTLALQNGVPYSHDLLRNSGALVRPELLTQLGIAVGDRILIGGRPFTIRGVIEQEPGRSVGGFSLGSRVLVDLADLNASGLLSFGSRANYQILLKVREDGVESLTRDIRRGFRDRFVNARSYRSTEDQIGENLQRAENFLSLVGFVIVVLGGIGVWSVTRVFVRQKIRSVAILKCVGASTTQVLATYVLQVALLALAGSLIGVLIAGAAMHAIPASLTTSFGGLSYGLTGSAVAQGLTVGLLVSVLFALVPLLDVRRIKPLLLIRGTDTGQVLVGRERRGAGFRARSIARLAGLDWLQIGTARRRRRRTDRASLPGRRARGALAWPSALGFTAVSLALYGAAFRPRPARVPLASAPWFPLRHAVISLRRPGNQTRVILLAVGLGSFFVLGVRALQSNLIAEFTVGADRGGADMFLIDVQRDQVEGVRALLLQRLDPATNPVRLVPVLRARVTAVRGREINLANSRRCPRPGIPGARVHDHLSRPSRGERGSGPGGILDDAPAAAAAGSASEVSIEQSIHERFNINVGDEMRFDVLGRTDPGEGDERPPRRMGTSRAGGFMFVFRPGVLADAPHTFVGFAKGPSILPSAPRLQYDLVSRFPTSRRLTAAKSLPESSQSSTTRSSGSPSSAALLS